MSTNAMIVVIIAILAWTAIRIARYRAGLGDPVDRRRHRHGEPQAPALLPEREKELLGEISNLRERVKVLERIATDNRQASSIAAEIESLRDK